MTQFSVRLSAANTPPMVVTKDVSRLRFKKTLKGGFASVNFDLKRGIDADELKLYSDVAISSMETGQPAGAGRLLTPGKSSGPNGEIWDMAAIGEGLAGTQDITQPYFLMDQRYEAWWQAFQAQKRAVWSQGDRPGGTTNGVLLNLSESIASGSGSRSDVRYRDMQQAKQLLASFKGTWDVGVTQSDSRLIAFASNFSTTGFVIVNGNPNGQAWNTAGGSFGGCIGAQFVLADGIDNVFVRYQRNNTTRTTADTDWAHLTGLVVRALMYDRTGALRTANAYYQNIWDLSPPDIIIDALVRFCPTIDVANAVVPSFSAFNPIEQWAFPDGISAYDIFEQLLGATFITPYTWEVWEKQSNGLHRFVWRQLPANTIYGANCRYEATDWVSFDRTGIEDDQVTDVWVTGQTNVGRYLTNKYSYLNTELNSIGRSRAKTISYQGGSFKSSQASDQADGVYYDGLYAAKAARLVLGAPIFDRWYGRMVEPWEVEPGYHICLYGVSTTADQFNPYTQRGAAKFLIVDNDHDVDSGQSTCELNAQAFTMQQALAGLLQDRVA